MFLEQTDDIQLIGAVVAASGDTVATSESTTSVSDALQRLLAPRDTTPPQPENTILFCWDSVMAHQVAVDSPQAVGTEEAIDTIHYRQSLFTGHSLTPTSQGLTLRNVDQNDVWIAISTILVILLTCIYFRAHRLGLQRAFSALFSRRAFAHMQRENNLTKSFNFLPSLLLMAATAAIYTFSIYHELHLPSLGWAEYLLIAAAAVGFALLFLLRNGIVALLGDVFGNREGVQRYLRSGYLCQLLLATCLLPLLLFFFYLPISPTLYIVLTALPIAAFFTINVANAVRIFFADPKGSNFYLIYYLCSLEIVPVLVLGKVLISL